MVQLQSAQEGEGRSQYFTSKIEKLYFVLKMPALWKWQKYLCLLFTLMFAGCGLFLIFVNLKTHKGEIWFQNVAVSRGLVLASGILSIILAIPCLVLFTYLQKVGDVKKNPRGKAVIFPLFHEILTSFKLICALWPERRGIFSMIHPFWSIRNVVNCQLVSDLRFSIVVA